MAGLRFKIKEMDRQRLTITLRSDVLKRLDQAIDGVSIRNRSHAIEYFLSKSLTPTITQAVILAGGEGVKMRPLTYEVPKPLILLSGKPLIEYTIELLREAGIREIIIAVGYLGDKIKEEVGSGKKYGVNIYYSEEKEPRGSAGALRGIKPFIGNQPFLVIHGDVLTKINLSDFISFHEKEKFIASLALSTASDTKGYGTVLLRGGRILKFIKDDKEKISQHINAGIYIFNPEIINFIPKKGEYNLESVFELLAREEKLAGFPFESAWFDISTPKNYEIAIKKWQKIPSSKNRTS